jgi:regulator of sigma E protease
MSDLAFTIASFLVALAILITAHEFGHFWVARKLGVRVLRFSIGFGTPLLRWVGRRDGTEYVIASLPLGGYVKMLDEREEAVPQSELHRAFNRQALWKRSAIVAAGPIFNFLLAIGLYWGVLVVGEEGSRPIIGTVAADSAAEAAGFAAGDELLEVAERPTPTWEAAVFALVSEAMDAEDLAVRVREASGAEAVRWLDGATLAGLTETPAILGNIGLDPARPVIAPILAEVLEDGAARRAGIEAGDRIVAAAGEPIDTWGQLVEIIRSNPETPVPFVIERDGTQLELTVTPTSVVEDGQSIGQIGVAVDIPEDLDERYRVIVRLGPVEAIGAAFEKTGDTTALMLRMIGRMLTGSASIENLSGPIAIAETAGKTASYGVTSFIKFLAIVSISLAVLNLLPVPVLDGGHLLFFLIEWIKGSPLSEQAQIWGQNIGILVLAVLITFAVYLDLSRLLG